MKLDEDLGEREPCGAVAAPEQLLAERAANAARAELRGERTGILGAIGSSAPPLLLSRTRRVPERWSLIHVMERMEEAFRILARLPTATRPRGYINSMPFYVYDRGDLNAQLETYELERLAKVRNRVRLPPSPAEIARMEEALRWPAAYLARCRISSCRARGQSRLAVGGIRYRCRQGLEADEDHAAHVQRPQAPGPTNHHPRAHSPPCPHPVNPRTRSFRRLRRGANQEREPLWSPPIVKDWGSPPSP